MQYQRSNVVAWIREFYDQPIDPDKDNELAFLDFLQIGAKRFPKMMKDEFEAAFTAYKVERDAERAILEEQLAELEFMIAFNSKHNIPQDMPWAEAVRMVAERGDPEAQAILREMDSPEAAVDHALMEAAIDAHPAWRRHVDGYLFNPEIGGPEDSYSLIDWYQRTHPHDASAITDRILNAA